MNAMRQFLNQKAIEILDSYGKEVYSSFDDFMENTTSKDVSNYVAKWMEEYATQSNEPTGGETKAIQKQDDKYHLACQNCGTTSKPLQMIPFRNDDHVVGLLTACDNCKDVLYGQRFDREEKFTPKPTEQPEGLSYVGYCSHEEYSGLGCPLAGGTDCQICMWYLKKDKLYPKPDKVREEVDHIPSCQFGTEICMICGKTVNDHFKPDRVREGAKKANEILKEIAEIIIERKKLPREIANWNSLNYDSVDVIEAMIRYAKQFTKPDKVRESQVLRELLALLHLEQPSNKRISEAAKAIAELINKD